MLSTFRGWFEVHAHVLVEVVLAREGFAAHVACVGTLSGVDSAMTCQFLVADKRLVAAWIWTLERPHTSNTAINKIPS